MGSKMSGVRGSGEPTMEEILSSIRRIISDEGPNPEIMRGGKAASVAPQPAPVAPPAAATPDPVLDLTEIMDEEPKHTPRASAPAKAVAEKATHVKPAPMKPQGVQPPPEPMPDMVSMTQTREALAPLAAPEAPAPRAPLPQAQALPPQPEPRAAAAPRAPVPLPTVNQALLSPKTQAQAGQALTELRQAAEQERSRAAAPPKEAPRELQGLEMLVLQALRPQLKAWLDQNLGPLVERIVREEVRRLTGQNNKS